jgi:hypothetical protein
MSFLRQALLLFLALGQVSISYAAPLEPATRLRKMSFFLRGAMQPSAQDFKELDAANTSEANLEDFFRRKAQEYTQSEPFVSNMLEKLEELFLIQTTFAIDEKIRRGQEIKDKTSDALRNLFRDILSLNLDWNSLLTAKTYRWSTENQKSHVAYYWGLTSPQFRPSFEGGFSASPSEKRLGGAITTPVFAQRYGASAINLGFRRAAAILRIFMCDPMKPMVNIEEATAANQIDPEILKFLFGTYSPTSKDEQKAMIQHSDMARLDRHASDPKCQGCHFKLNPAGQVLSAIGGVGLSNESTPGGLTYKENGQIKSLPAKNIGEFAQSITQQRQYLECQVKNFWGWFMPTDSVLTDTHLAQLTEKFDDLGRKPKDFAAYLTTQPEFADSSLVKANDSMIFQTKIKSTFAKCAQCHMAMPLMPDFTKLPLGGNSDLNETWISKIAQRLDLKHEGKGRSMPPRNIDWDVDSSFIALVKEWIKRGSPDEMGKATLSPEAASKILGGSM